MISLVVSNNRHDLPATLRGMHRDRKRVFVDWLKWDVPVVDGQYEIDQFDTASAVYLVRLGAGVEHLGSLRLLPTTEPHLLDTIFAQPLGIEDLPTGPTIWEASRICTNPDIDKETATRVRRELGVAMAEYGLATGITDYTYVTHSAYVPTMLAAGWEMRPLSLPTNYGGQQLEAIAMCVTPATVPTLRRNFGITYPVLGPCPPQVRRAA
jgi:acyl-homoserine lactone synthase